MWQIIVTFLVAVLIIYLSYICTKYIGKSISAGRRSRYMRVIDQITLGQERYLAIVQIGVQYYWIGIASGQINVLSEVQEEDLVQIMIPEKPMDGMETFKEAMDKLISKGKRGK